MKYVKAPALLLTLLCLLSAVLFSACEEESAPEDIVGTWKIVECIVDGEALTDMDDCFFYFREDGTGEKVIEEEHQFSYQYTYDGKTCVLFNITYEDGETEGGTYAEMKVKGDKMTVRATEDGVEERVTLKRQKP